MLMNDDGHSMRQLIDVPGDILLDKGEIKKLLKGECVESKLPCMDEIAKKALKEGLIIGHSNWPFPQAGITARHERLSTPLIESLIGFNQGGRPVFVTQAISTVKESLHFWTSRRIVPVSQSIGRLWDGRFEPEHVVLRSEPKQTTEIIFRVPERMGAFALLP
jgi:hypothetical protein